MNDEQRTGVSPWIGLVTGPVIFLINVQISFVTLPWVCVTGQYWAIGTAAAASSTLVLLSGYSAYQMSQQPLPAGDKAAAVNLQRFMGFMGLLAAAFFTVAIASLWLPAFFTGACR